MAKIVEVKNCIRCNKEMYNVDIATRYCPECRKEVDLEYGRKQSKQRTKKKDTKTKLNENMKNLNPHEYQLTPNGFNEISSISTSTYLNYYKMPWNEILRVYNLENNLINYIIEEYKIYMDNNNSQDLKTFGEKHKYITTRLLKKIGYDYLRSISNVKKQRNTVEDYKDNFFDIVNELGRIPLYPEFAEMTKITITNYANRLNLKGKIYDNIVKRYVPEKEYKEYLKDKNNHKTEMGKITGAMSATYTDEDYEKEFHRVFEYCLNTFGNLPSNDLFNSLSKLDESNYRRKFNRSWTQVCGMYGYKVDKTANKSEKVTLEVVKSILNEDYIPQQTFDWLRGVNNFVLFCDGYYPIHNLIVEFDGRQHNEPVDKFGGVEAFETLQANDQIKNELIPEHGLKLVRISCYEPFWNKEYIQNKLIECNII